MKDWTENISKEVSTFQDRITVYGNTIFIKDKKVCVKPLCSTLEAIQKLKPATTIKGCRSFAEMVNFVCIFCPELHKIIKTHI